MHVSCCTFVRSHYSAPLPMIEPLAPQDEAGLWDVAKLCRILEQGLASASRKEPQSPKNRTNSAKEFSEQFEGLTGHDPLKQGFWGKSHQKVHPKVRRNHCRKSSLGYFSVLDGYRQERGKSRLSVFLGWHVCRTKSARKRKKKLPGYLP